MATSSRSNELESNHYCGNYSRYECLLPLKAMLMIVGDQLTRSDIRVLKYLYSNIISDSILSNIHSGYDFLLALERHGRVDESNLKHILHLLKLITRHDLLQFVTLQKRKTVKPDPVEEFLLDSARKSTVRPFKRRKMSDSECVAGRQLSHGSSDLADAAVETEENAFVSFLESRRTNSVPSSTESVRENHSVTSVTDSETEKKKKLTCNIRLRVRAEYCNHQAALEGNIHSNKPELIERRFEKFQQANNILKSRDLGSIICDIKFSELTYLDAFWRDYINGSLLEALKNVFITESLKQAVGHEAIKLLVNVDEDDYTAGRLVLLNKLQA